MTKPPPHNPEAEGAVLGASMASPHVAELVASAGADVFYRPAHRAVAQAVSELVGREVRVDPVSVLEHLTSSGKLDEVGGATAVHELHGMMGAPANAEHYLSKVLDTYRRRQVMDGARALHSEAASGGDYEAVLVQLDQGGSLLDQGKAHRAVGGGAFVLDQPAEVPAVWGQGDGVLWSAGEPLMLVGPPGAGKTTIAQQVVLGRVGLRDTVLGQPVVPGYERVLYLAMDRPLQIARSFRRMVSEEDRDRLDDRLLVWRGPLPFALADDPKALRRMAQEHDADSIVIDSLKDLEPALESPEGGNRVNSAVQECVAEGIEVASLHHQRKAQGDNKKPKSLADVYGSVWLTAGAGSVVLIWGNPGDPVVELRHLKQPAGEVGPWTLIHDHVRGHTTVEEDRDPLLILRGSPKGVTAKGLAVTIFGTPDPTRSQVAKATRQLQRLHADGHAHKQPGSKGGPGGTTPDIYLPAAPPSLEDVA